MPCACHSKGKGKKSVKNPRLPPKSKVKANFSKPKPRQNYG